MKLNVKLKVVGSDSFHRFTVDGTPGPDYDALKSKITDIAKSAFGIIVAGDTDQFKVTYTDDEGDQCVLASQDDLQTALQFLPSPTAPLRLTLEQAATADGAEKKTAPTDVQHSRRWYAVRGLTPPTAGEQAGRPTAADAAAAAAAGGWHGWAVDKFGPRPARRLAAAWCISPAQAAEKLKAAQAGHPEALAAVEAALLTKPAEEAAAPGEEERAEDSAGWDGWGIHQHGWGTKGKGGGKGHMKGKMKGKMKGMMLAHEMMMMGGAAGPEMMHDMMMGGGGDWHHGDSWHHPPHHGKGKGWGWGGKRHCGGGRGGGGRGCGGPAHQLAEALSIDKHAAWALLKAAAAGDAAAAEQVRSVLGEDAEAKLDAEWMEKKLAKRADKMAGKSEALQAKAAWFAASGSEKDQKKAAKLRCKAQKVESKGQDFQKMAACMLQPKAAAAPPPAEEAAEEAAGAAPAAPAACEVVETGPDAAVVHPSMAPIEAVVITGAPVSGRLQPDGPAEDAARAEGEEGDGLLVDLDPPAAAEPAPAPAADGPADGPLVPPEWTAAMDTMTNMMGFDPAASIEALHDHNGNVQLAVSQLIGGTR